MATSRLRASLGNFLHVANEPIGFGGLDLTGVLDGDVVSYQASGNKLIPTVGGSGLPAATQRGQVLYSTDGSNFSVQLPLTSQFGWLVNSDGEHIVVG